MADLFAKTGKTKSSSRLKIYREPIRGSMFILLLRIFFVLAGIDIIYLILRVFGFDLNIRWIPIRDIDIGFLLLLVSFYVVQIFLIYTILLQWLNTRYFIDDKQLIANSGIFVTKERIYDLENIKSVQMSQGVLARFCKYGTVTIIITSPNLLEEINLTDISHPESIERYFKKFI